MSEPYSVSALREIDGGTKPVVKLREGLLESPRDVRKGHLCCRRLNHPAADDVREPASTSKLIAHARRGGKVKEVIDQHQRQDERDHARQRNADAVGDGISLHLPPDTLQRIDQHCWRHNLSLRG